MADPVPRRVRRGVGREVEGLPCQCTPDGQLCLLHYSELNPGRRAAARRRVGVRELYVEAQRY